VRPTPPQFPLDLPPDELMLEWGHIPSDATASIYLPAADADEILDLAGQLYDAHRLTKVDDHTLACPTGGVTFVPVPRGADPNFAGLLTVELPAGIRKGNVHEVTVRQITTALARIPRQTTHRLDTAPPALKGGAAADDDEPADEPPATIIEKSFAGKQAEIGWRRVLGMFNLTIPVATKGELLAPEERLLSVLRWIQQAIPLESRWFLVFQRYVNQIADRVVDMGGDPDRVRADPNGDWDHKIKARGGEHDRHDRDDRHERGERGERGEARIRFTGKIASLEYDRYGDYEAFLLDTEDGLRRFEGREAELEALAERAWRHRITVSVYAERHDPDRPLKIVLQAASAALED
jgi:hypothetical protein